MIRWLRQCGVGITLMGLRVVVVLSGSIAGAVGAHCYRLECSFSRSSTRLRLNVLKSRSIWHGLSRDQRVPSPQRYPATVAPARSVRRSTARRASKRRATARSRQTDIKTRIIEFLAKHPGSTAGDIAKALNVNPGSVSTRLTQLAKTGQIQKATRGYSVK